MIKKFTVRRTCIICGARVRNQNPSPKINFCSSLCKEARDNERTLAEQIKFGIDNLWEE